MTQRPRLVSIAGRAAIAIPIAALVVLLLATARGLWQQNAVTHAQIYQAVARHLGAARARRVPSFVLFHRAVPYPPCSAFDEVAWNALSPDRPAVYLFGESSLTLSDGKRVDYFLGRALRERFPDVSMINFAYCGIDSFFIRQWVDEAMAGRGEPPRLVILYFGHNDYNNAHAEAISPLYNQFPWAMWLAYKLSRLNWDNADWSRRLNTGPEVKWAQKLGLVRIPSEGLCMHNELILAAFAENLAAIVATCHAHSVPVIVVTPVGNLRLEPYGSISEVTVPFERGRSEPDYGRSLRLLRQARDAAHLTADTAAKTPLIELIRGLHAPDVFPLDFEALLERESFDFGSSGFTDYLHLRESLHERLARALYDLIVANPELTARLAAKGPLAK